MITIHLIRQNFGNSLPAQVVLLSFGKPLRGWTTPQVTDEEGRVAFAVSPSVGTVYVNGTAVFTGWLAAESTIHLAQAMLRPSVPYWRQRLQAPGLVAGEVQQGGGAQVQAA